MLHVNSRKWPGSWSGPCQACEARAALDRSWPHTSQARRTAGYPPHTVASVRKRAFSCLFRHKRRSSRPCVSPCSTLASTINSLGTCLPLLWEGYKDGGDNEQAYHAKQMYQQDVAKKVNVNTIWCKSKNKNRHTAKKNENEDTRIHLKRPLGKLKYNRISDSSNM